MKLVEIDWRPKDRILRQFGGIALVALPLLAWLWGLTGAAFWAVAGLGGVCGLLAVLAPRALRLPFLALTVLTFPLGLVMSELVLAIAFYLVFTPIGLLLRLYGRDELQLRLDRESASYWQPKARPAGAASYFRQS